MALAEELESPQNTGPLGRDQFVKRRQAAREAAQESGTPEPGDGDETSPLAEAIEGEQEQVQDETPESEPSTPEDPLAGIFDDDELGVEAEPTTLSGLEPPASLSAAEKETFEGASDELKAIISRVSKAAAQKVQEGGESLAARNKEIDDRVAELDRALIEAKAVLDVKIDDLPFKPPFSEDDLDKIFNEQGAEAERAAQKQNRQARAEHQAALEEMKAEREKQQAEVDAKLKERREQIATKFRDDLPKLIPTWSKPEVAKKEASELSTYLTQQGFSEAELRQVADARLVMLSRKAMKYDRALAAARERRTGKAKPNSTARPAPAGGRSSKPSNNAQLEAAEKRYRKNPSADNFAALRAAKREAAPRPRRV